MATSHIAPSHMARLALHASRSPGPVPFGWARRYRTRGMSGGRALVMVLAYEDILPGCTPSRGDPAGYKTQSACVSGFEGRRLDLDGRERRGVGVGRLLGGMAFGEGRCSTMCR